ncbi:group II intron reverse transcriptase domain-containing protein [Candidatus Collierbacteria bacterium]|nr:group II intron reverse transcriptase domain-containing protein [Candidatus Collierbacteria bacterium]
MYTHLYDLENLLYAYAQAQQDNRYKRKICAFTFSLEENLFDLRWELSRGLYVPRPYTYFMLHDPKTRSIAAPNFRDRVVQHALVNVIQPLFERQFIYDSYACRTNKGTHFAAKRLKKFLMAARSFHGKDTPIYVLQCDIRKFFQSVSWDILLKIIGKTISCQKTVSLIKTIVTTHHNVVPAQTPLCSQLSLFSSSENPAETSISVAQRTGLPIGNLTSQLFANVYLNALDHFIKDRLRIRWYGRYMDDFFVLHHDRAYLKQLCDTINTFLQQKLHLCLHPKKLTIKNVSSGVPFVGYRIFYDHVLVRGNTLRRIERSYRSKVKQAKHGRLTSQKLAQTKASIIGHFKHANSYGLTKKLFEKNE